MLSPLPNGAWRPHFGPPSPLGCSVRGAWIVDPSVKKFPNWTLQLQNPSLRPFGQIKHPPWDSGVRRACVPEHRQRSALSPFKWCQVSTTLTPCHVFDNGNTLQFIFPSKREHNPYPGHDTTVTGCSWVCTARCWIGPVTSGTVSVIELLSLHSLAGVCHTMLFVKWWMFCTCTSRSWSSNHSKRFYTTSHSLHGPELNCRRRVRESDTLTRRLKPMHHVKCWVVRFSHSTTLLASVTLTPVNLAPIRVTAPV